MISFDFQLILNNFSINKWFATIPKQSECSSTILIEEKFEHFKWLSLAEQWMVVIFGLDQKRALFLKKAF